MLDDALQARELASVHVGRSHGHIAQRGGLEGRQETHLVLREEAELVTLRRLRVAKVSGTVKGIAQELEERASPPGVRPWRAEGQAETEEFVAGQQRPAVAPGTIGS